MGNTNEGFITEFVEPEDTADKYENRGVYYDCKHFLISDNVSDYKPKVNAVVLSLQNELEMLR